MGNLLTALVDLGLPAELYQEKLPLWENSPGGALHGDKTCLYEKSSGAPVLQHHLSPLTAPQLCVCWEDAYLHQGSPLGVSSIALEAYHDAQTLQDFEKCLERARSEPLDSVGELRKNLRYHNAHHTSEGPLEAWVERLRRGMSAQIAHAETLARTPANRDSIKEHWRTYGKPVQDPRNVLVAIHKIGIESAGREIQRTIEAWRWGAKEEYVLVQCPYYVGLTCTGETGPLSALLDPRDTPAIIEIAFTLWDSNHGELRDLRNALIAARLV